MDGPRLVRRTLRATHLLGLRTKSGVLADPKLRAAVAHALDRRAMAGIPTSCRPQISVVGMAMRPS